MKFKEILINDELFTLDKTHDKYKDIDNKYAIVKSCEVSGINKFYASEAFKSFMALVPIFKDMRFIFVKNIGEKLEPIYVEDTALTMPVILLNERSMKIVSRQYQVHIDILYKHVVNYGLGLAIMDLESRLFGNKYLKYVKRDKWAEDLSVLINNEVKLPEDLLEFIDAMGAGVDAA